MMLVEFRLVRNMLICLGMVVYVIEENKEKFFRKDILDDYFEVVLDSEFLSFL